MERCAALFPSDQIILPRLPSAKNLWLNQSLDWGTRAPRPGARRLWLMLSVGSDFEMLRLHLLTLADVVDGFLVTESRDTFTRHAKKPALLTDALAAGDVFPPALARKIHVRVVDLEHAATYGHCSGRPVGYPRTSCAESWQRFNLFGMLLKRARAHDVAVLADADEIARPSVLTALKTCFPFSRDNDHGAVSKYILRGTHYEFGLHCRRMEWDHGPHAYPAGHLFRRFHKGREQLEGRGAVAQSQSEPDSFSNLRGESGFRLPIVMDASWHLSSFGGAAMLQNKFRSWGHANMCLGLRICISVHVHVYQCAIVSVCMCMCISVHVHVYQCACCMCISVHVHQANMGLAGADDSPSHLHGALIPFPLPVWVYLLHLLH